ncbi:TIGR01777 family oxidoreductase [Desulfovibrio ferrophilus]|uniref:TIGR01777 family protein n=1 Tax=Desulfovibrio ferrophilus TaxID=241368 RepID=A0A2Z6AVU0_9BACT|nr:TIGR01777 family oxidoreductase [Desulfovibrio ferrophilus]BBD07306.1 putative uncharacterized protein [Desulfovibrio ferrophilus]
MYVIVTGGTGFIGRALVAELQRSGHGVAVPSRLPEKARAVLGPGVDCVAWDGVDSAPLVRLLDNAGQESAVVNLAGEGIANGRWTVEKKAAILNSRIRATEAVTSATLEATKPPAVILQGSAVGYYGYRASEHGEMLDETKPQGEGFLAEVCLAWETVGTSVAVANVRQVVIRTGLVIGTGGVLAKFLPPFRFFMGGPLGNGEQWMPWIHLSDQVGAIRWLLENDRAEGVYNLCAPTPVSMSYFCTALGRAVHRPSWLPVPSAALRLLLGREMADETVLASQRAVPTRLLAEGFQFRMIELGSALSEAINTSG